MKASCVEIFGERDQLPSRAAVVHTKHLRFTEWLAGGSFSAGASFLLEPVFCWSQFSAGASFLLEI